MWKAFNLHKCLSSSSSLKISLNRNNFWLKFNYRVINPPSYMRVEYLAQAIEQIHAESKMSWSYYYKKNEVFVGENFSSWSAYFCCAFYKSFHRGRLSVGTKFTFVSFSGLYTHTSTFPDNKNLIKKNICIM